MKGGGASVSGHGPVGGRKSISPSLFTCRAQRTPVTIEKARHNDHHPLADGRCAARGERIRLTVDTLWLSLTSLVPEIPPSTNGNGTHVRAWLLGHRRQTVTRRQRRRHGHACTAHRRSRDRD
jgi:hypothetical protein